MIAQKRLDLHNDLPSADLILGLIIHRVLICSAVILKCNHLCRKKGYPAITDANLVLGRILPEFFPAIFGETEDQPLDADASFKALEEIAEEVNIQSKKRGQPEKSVDEVRTSFLQQTCNITYASDLPWMQYFLSISHGRIWPNFPLSYGFTTVGTSP